MACWDGTTIYPHIEATPVTIKALLNWIRGQGSVCPCRPRVQAREAAGSRDTLELSVVWSLAVLRSVAGLTLTSLLDLTPALFSVFFKLRKSMLQGMDRHSRHRPQPMAAQMVTRSLFWCLLETTP